MAKRKTSSRRTNSVVDNYPLAGVFGIPTSNNQSGISFPFTLANAESYYLVSLQRVILTYAYTLFGPLRTLVDQPVYDAFRGGIKIKSDQLSPEEITLLEKRMKRSGLIRAIRSAMRWDGLYGGAGVIVNVEQNHAAPLDLESIEQGSQIQFIAADRWELAWMGVPNSEDTLFSYYNKKIHQSRVAKLIGEEAPSLARQRLQGWGMSKIEAVIRELNSYFKHQNVTFEILDESKVDLYKIKGFNAAALQQAAQGKLTRRFQIVNEMKNFLNAIILDKEDDYEIKNQTFSGLADILEQIRIGMAAAIRMPMAKIFGLAAKGFASGEDDLENYNGLVENEREKAEDVLEILVPALCMIEFGMVPEDLEFEWKPLRTLTAEQLENVKNSEFNRLTSLRSSGHLNPVEYMKSLKEADIFTMETEVGKGLVEPEDNRPMMGEDGDGEEITEESSGAKPSDGKKPTEAKE